MSKIVIKVQKSANRNFLSKHDTDQATVNDRPVFDSKF